MFLGKVYLFMDNGRFTNIVAHENMTANRRERRFILISGNSCELRQILPDTSLISVYDLFAMFIGSVVLKQLHLRRTV